MYRYFSKEKTLQNHIQFQSKRASLRVCTKKLLRKQRSALFLDIDGTIWPDSGKSLMLGDLVLDHSIQWSIMNIRKHFDFLILITNQSLFAQMVNIDTKDIRRYSKNISALHRLLRFDLFLVCHHHPHAQNRNFRFLCNYRKPGSEMFTLAQEILNLDLKKCIMIGDRITDVIAATDAGIVNNFIVKNANVFYRNEGANEPKRPLYPFRLTTSIEEVFQKLSESIHA